MAHRLGGQAGGADGPGPGTEGGGEDRDRRPEGGALQQGGEGGPDRVEQQVAQRGQPAADHEGLRVEDVGQVGQPQRHPPAQLAQHPAGVGVAGPGGGGHVLAPHRLRVAPGQLQHRAGPSRLGRLPGQPAEAAARREPLPAAPLAARARRARP